MRHAAAFTLVEAIVAIVVLAVAVPPMLLALRETHATRTAPVLTDRARWLGTARLEEIIADRHSPTRGWAYIHDSSYPDETPVSGWPGFARTVAISETGVDLLSPGTGYKTVAVSVAWTDAGGVARTLTLSAVLTDYIP